MARSYDRSIRLDAQTYERIKHTASQYAIPVSAWIRMAIKNQLHNETTKTEVSELREELAANFRRILNQCRALSNAQQTGIAIVDTLSKYLLSIGPEPGADSQKIGRRRYEQFLKSVATALEGDVLRAFPALNEGDKNPNGAETGITPRQKSWKQ